MCAQAACERLPDTARPKEGERSREELGTELDRSPGRTRASPVIAVPVGANRDIEVHLVVHVIGLGLAKVPLDA